MNLIQRIFHFHKWIAIKAKWYLDTSYDDAGVKSTTATYKCSTCDKVKTECHYNAGYITLEELNTHVPTKTVKGK